MSKITVHKLSKATGLSLQTIKWWHSLNLVPSTKDESNGYYYFDESSFDTINDVNFLRQIGISLKDVVKVMNFSAKDIIEFYKKQIKIIDSRIKQLSRNMDVMIERIRDYETLKNRLYSPPLFKSPYFDILYDIPKLENLKSADDYKLSQLRIKENWYEGSVVTTKDITYPEKIDCEYNFNWENFIAARNKDETIDFGRIIWTKNPNCYYINIICYRKLYLSNPMPPSKISTYNSLGSIKAGEGVVLERFLNELLKFGYMIEEIVAKFFLYDTDETAHNMYFDNFIGVRPMNEEEKTKYGVEKIVPLEDFVAKE